MESEEELMMALSIRQDHFLVIKKLSKSTQADLQHEATEVQMRQTSTHGFGLTFFF